MQCSARLVMAGRGEEALEQSVGELNALYPEAKAIGVAADISNPDQTAPLIEKTLDDFGHLDGVVCNAGGNKHFGPLMSVPDDGFDGTVEINTQANIRFCQVADEALEDGAGGSIVINSSAAAFSASDVLAGHGVSKLAMLGVMSQLAFELRPKGINVNAICPSVMRTDFSKVMWAMRTLRKRWLHAFPWVGLARPMISMVSPTCC